MRRRIINYCQEFWNWMVKILADKCGELPFGEDKPWNQRRDEVAEREIVINNTKIHIKSIFTGKTTLEKAMKNIVVQKISDAKSEQ